VVLKSDKSSGEEIKKTNIFITEEELKLFTPTISRQDVWSIWNSNDNEIFTETAKSENDYAWVDNNEKEVAIHDDQVLRVLKKIRQEMAAHDAKTSLEHNKLLSELKTLQIENEYFRHQLYSINTPNKLRKYSICSGAVSIISLTVSKFFHINLVHPVAAYFIFTISAVFYLMSIIMLRENK